jgi:hypothetical protein
MCCMILPADMASAMDASLPIYVGEHARSVGEHTRSVGGNAYKMGLSGAVPLTIGR